MLTIIIIYAQLKSKNDKDAKLIIWERRVVGKGIMANHFIFIDRREIPETSLGVKSSYSYNNGILSIYRKKKMIFSRKALLGEGFTISCQNGRVTVRELVPPTTRGKIVSWLLGFWNHNRGRSYRDYLHKLSLYKERYQWEFYEEVEYSSENYIFTMCNAPYSMVRIRPVAGLFSNDITKEEILELIPFMSYHPEWYVERILWEYLDITEEEFKEARKKTV